MRRWLFLVLLASACTTTSAVDSRGVSRLEVPTSGEAIYISDEHGGKLRVEPNSLIRFKRTDGSKTPWVRARQLHVNGRGVFRIHRLQVDDSRRAEVHGLPPDGVALLKRSKPHDAELVSVGEVHRLTGPRGSLAAWATAYLAHRGDLGAVTDSWWANDDGKWRFFFPFGAWSTPIDGRALDDAVHNGVTVPVGLAFADMEGAEIKNVSPSKSLALVVGVAGVAAVVAALAVAGADGKLGSGGGNFAVASADVAVHMIGHVASACAGRCEERRRTLPKGALISPMQHSPDAVAARPLFSGVARRRSDIQVVVASAVGYGVAGEGEVPSTISGAMRIRDLVELGGGLRYVVGRPDGRFIGFARVGGVFHIDDEHRLAVALLFDIGGGSSTLETKLNTGLRYRIGSGVSVGVYPFNPTYLRVGAGEQATTTWSFPSTLELSWAF